MAKGYKKSKIPQFGPVLQRFRIDALVTATVATRKFAEAESKGFQDDIKAQRFTSFRRKPLSQIWKAIKARHGADPRVMIATSHYVNSIKVFSKKDGKRTQFRIGFSPTAHARTLDHRISPKLLSDIADIHERGRPAAHIPARPHWGPYLRGMRQRATVLARSLSNRIAARGRLRLERGH